LKYHHYLLAIETLFKISSSEDLPIIRKNILLKANEQRITVRDMSRAQQGMVAMVSEEAGEVIQPVSMTVLAVMYLGEMTDEEFNNVDAPVGDLAIN
jgi:hypothetical protein